MIHLILLPTLTLMLPICDDHTEQLLRQGRERQHTLEQTQRNQDRYHEDQMAIERKRASQHR